ncbi:hypothetical protein [Albimonas pacifica]|uniref:DUF2214 domain-containing protein n=1 Tax=Albimonas pacifica TaxID=1114924 RepID=A0A1I3I4L3_9RHOB|nr:hypothetical protein [Albimonas pacifica]SFI42852.1 hypothetical protein SAMN05216258_106335 [Albimonas pacifica]
MWDWLAALPPAEAMRSGRWLYAWVSAAHVAGLALLVGAIAPLDLRLIGLRRDLPLAPLAALLVPAAATGLALALVSGALLFLAAPADYAAQPLFWGKLALVALGAGSALAMHLGPGLALASPASLRRAGAISLACWAPALVAGRMLAFVD